MGNEVTVPLLPCGDIDEIAAFYAVLGFQVTYRQPSPPPYAALRRGDVHLHFFEVPDFDPDGSYGSCLILVDDIGALHRAFADGMRTAYGTVMVSGRPRMTRPRVRRTTGRLTGFSVIDPCGNWIRVSALAETLAETPAETLAARAGEAGRLTGGRTPGRFRRTPGTRSPDDAGPRRRPRRR